MSLGFVGVVSHCFSWLARSVIGFCGFISPLCYCIALRMRLATVSFGFVGVVSHCFSYFSGFTRTLCHWILWVWSATAFLTFLGLIGLCVIGFCGCGQPLFFLLF